MIFKHFSSHTLSRLFGMGNNQSMDVSTNGNSSTDEDWYPIVDGKHEATHRKFNSCLSPAPFAHCMCTVSKSAHLHDGLMMSLPHWSQTYSVTGSPLAKVTHNEYFTSASTTESETTDSLPTGSPSRLRLIHFYILLVFNQCEFDPSRLITSAARNGRVTTIVGGETEIEAVRTKVRPQLVVHTLICSSHLLLCLSSQSKTGRYNRRHLYYNWRHQRPA
jgi:hypothetical protein